MITVVRSVYGGYDPPRPVIPQSVPFTEILVNENSHPRPHMHPRLAAKHAKCLPFDYVSDDTDMVVWLDGSFDVASEHYLAFLREQSEGHLISQYKHPVRDDVLIEADVSATMLKYQGQPVHALANHYLAQGHPRHWGMWSTGIAVYRITGYDDRMVLMEYGRHWLAEQVRWTYQDQISQPHVLRLHGLRPYEIQDDFYASPYVWLHGHTRED